MFGERKIHNIGLVHKHGFSKIHFLVLLHFKDFELRCLRITMTQSKAKN
jgi:hypothetical protein